MGREASSERAAGRAKRGTIAARALPRRGSYANAVASKNRSSTFRVMRETLLS